MDLMKLGDMNKMDKLAFEQEEEESMKLVKR